MMILGLDISMTNTGWVMVEVHPSEPMAPVAAGVVSTKKNDDADMKATADNLRRVGDQWWELHRVVQTWKPTLLVVEAMSWPRNAGAATKMAMVWGAVAALQREFNLAVIPITASVVRKRLLNKKAASKAEVSAFLAEKYGGVRMMELHGTLPESRHEHIDDALATVLASAFEDTFRVALNFERRT